MVRFELVKEVLDKYILEGRIGDAFVRRDLPVEGINPCEYTEIYITESSNTYEPFSMPDGGVATLEGFENIKEDFLEFIGAMIASDLASVHDTVSDEFICDSISVFGYYAKEDTSNYIKLSELNIDE